MDRSPTVIVTGASRGVGAATARWLASKGANLTLVARTENSLENIAAQIKERGGTALPITTDIANSAACHDIVNKTLDRFENLTGLVNNAGILTPLETLALSKAEDWRYNIEVNLLGPAYLSMAAIPALRRHRGRIINVSSGAAHHAVAAASAYCAAKAGLNQLTRVLAAEESELTIIAVRPGHVDTPMQELLRELGPVKMPPAQADYYLKLKENGQLESPAVPARSVAWMVLHAPPKWSGAFMSYDDPQITEPAVAIFGNRAAESE